jgi:hypothetical protein
MESTHRTLRFPWRNRLAFAVLAGGLLITGCGNREKDYANDPRPPSPLNVAAYISSDRVSVSPSTFGAGPIVVIVTNQSGVSQEVTLTGDEVTQSTGPINPGDTGQMKVFAREGTYTLLVSAGGVRSATVNVGPERESAQNQVLQP